MPLSSTSVSTSLAILAVKAMIGAVVLIVDIAHAYASYLHTYLNNLHEKNKNYFFLLATNFISYFCFYKHNNTPIIRALQSKLNIVCYASVSFASRIRYPLLN
jgi:dsRNA-specific ribonuclease